MTAVRERAIDITGVPMLEEILCPVSSISADTFRVDSQEKAAWAARKVLESERRIEERRELASAYKAKIDSWYAQANRDDEETVEKFRAYIRPYIETEVERKHGSKTVKLPGIDVSLRKTPDKVD